MKAKLPYLVALLALLLYLPPERSAFWFDEVYTARLATFPLETAWRELREDAHPPLFYALLRGYAGLLGLRDGPDRPSPPAGVEASLRLPNALVGAATVFVVSRFGHPLAGLLLLASPFWDLKVREARMYPLFAFLLTLSYASLLQGRPFGAGLFGALALWTHYLGLLYAPLLGLPLLLKRKAYALLPYLSFLLWLPVFAPSLGRGTNAHLRPDPVSNVAAIGELGGYPLGLALMAVPLLAAYARRKEPERVYLLLLPYLLVLAWWLTGYLVNTASPRYWGAFLPPMALSLGVALREAPFTPPFRRVLLGLLLLAGAGGVYLVAVNPAKALYEGYDQHAALLRAMEGRGRPLVLGNEPSRLLSLVYYYRSPEAELLVPDPDLARLGEPWRERPVLLYLNGSFIGLEGAPPLEDLFRPLKREGCHLAFLAEAGILAVPVLCPEVGRVPR